MILVRYRPCGFVRGSLALVLGRDRSRKIAVTLLLFLVSNVKDILKTDDIRILMTVSNFFFAVTGRYEMGLDGK
jgi:hypothetical protein